MNYEGKKVLVTGMARSGIAAAQLLRAAGAQVTVNDTKTREQLGEGLSVLEGLDLDWQLGCPAEPLLPGKDVLVISPGISVHADFVQKAREMGLYVIGELELAWQLSQGTLVAVTGTNGKTTTVSLLGEIFQNAGRTTHVVGNIGYPYSLAAMVSQPEDVVVCEVSSFQMETADTFHPHVALLTNITEDHLNRHGTMEVYTEMKMRLFRRQDPADWAVFNADDPGLEGLCQQVRSRVIQFSRKKEVPEGAFVREGEIIFRLDGRERTVCRPEEIRIPGPHNLENALGAICCAAVMEVPLPVIRQTLHTFPGVEHRIESVRILHGVEYFNDSKGTNVDSTLKAVETMTRPTILILGGYDKKVSFDPLSREIQERRNTIRETVLIGQTAPQIEESLRRAGYDHILHAQTLKEAVLTCQQIAEEGWNVLLSPACASFDMFKDYEERGRIFKKIVNEL